ncbi:MAG: hypothetical protein U0841_07220 [Chloroflexia bacterium]
MSDGTVKAWGDNIYGQLGDGTTDDRNAPVTVSGLGAGSGVTTISLPEFSHSVVRLSDGSVKAWGYNTYGSGRRHHYPPRYAGGGERPWRERRHRPRRPGTAHAGAVLGWQRQSLGKQSQGTDRRWHDLQQRLLYEAHAGGGERLPARAAA